MVPSYAASLLFAVIMVSIQSVASAEVNSSIVDNSNSTNFNVTGPVVTLPVSKSKEAGLPGVVYAGVAIGVVAVAGFFVECCLHKRNYWSKRSEINAGLNANLQSNRIV
ncbi:hypothetical protein H310_13068 [Aphanomyces invadans]|uniref:Transmembrane protein n=1 Tax=Aphanomyces invadans TaxID=157072 RepID=A0A024TF22_9STRA|nr:hypothetical protein H310_13068 [Aphanomyces invadans]ETV92614.1 hypothetical protein H310_13068 [Aphanomyces invadans]|eukprot:XP_008878650.1 hypothetical protein H310_13068 [Aphanomyces invadans]